MISNGKTIPIQLNQCQSGGIWEIQQICPASCLQRTQSSFWRKEDDLDRLPCPPLFFNNIASHGDIHAPFPDNPRPLPVPERVPHAAVSNTRSVLHMEEDQDQYNTP